MIIFGTRTKFLTSLATAQDCGYCHSGKLNLAYTIRYFHIFWIPMFPLGRQLMTQCPHCKQMLTEREIHPQTKANLFGQNISVKTPLKYYFGLILIGTLILLVALIKTMDKKGRYIDQPQVGDVYQVKGVGNNNLFTLWKVTAVEPDSVVLAVHQQSKIAKADINEKAVFGKLDKGFSENTFKMAKRNIKSMTRGKKNLAEVYRK